MFPHDSIFVENMDNIEIFRGETPLMKSAYEGNLENVKNLIKNGANVNAKDNFGRTALLLACGNLKGLQVVQYLLKNGADIEIETINGLNALIWAAFNGNIKVVKELIKNGADINDKDHFGESALIWAVYHGHIDTIK